MSARYRRRAYHWSKIAKFLYSAHLVLMQGVPSVIRRYFAKMFDIHKTRIIADTARCAKLVADNTGWFN